MDREDRSRRFPLVRTEEEQRAVRRHRAEASWYAWTLGELARYLFGLGLLAAVVFVPLQLADVWLPRGLPAVLPPGLVAFFAVMFIAGALFLGWRAYIFLWASGGWIERQVARHEADAGEPRDREGH